MEGGSGTAIESSISDNKPSCRRVRVKVNDEEKWKSARESEGRRPTCRSRGQIPPVIPADSQKHSKGGGTCMCLFNR